MANQIGTFDTPGDTPARPPRPPRPPRSPRPAPLPAVLGFTCLNSLGTGAVQMGIFFLLRSAYGFGRRENYLFGLVLYGVYVIGALAAGPMMNRLRAVGLSTRIVLAAVLVAQAAASFIPGGVARLGGTQIPPQWTVWLAAIGYGVFTGIMWPIVESYLSGGRSGKALNAATGRFNVLWSGAVLASFWLMAPLVEQRPIDVITALGVVQIASAGLLVKFGPNPAKHLPHQHEPHPESWKNLLSAFRVLLPLAYIVAGTLSPLLPTTLDQIGIREAWAPPVASAWLTSRVVVFFIFERWPGWHGRRWVPVLAGGLLLFGFAGTVIAPRLGPAALPVLIGTLTLFGAGHAMIYLGALYYALEVGRAEVNAGGVHEALIGLGYALGPAIGLVLILLGTSGPNFDSWLILVVSVVSVLAGLRTLRILHGRRNVHTNFLE
ncbi:MAG TPA: hypothetical protein ENK11_01195 [Phycisphaerales bacterium]|nr:hypothetical protein [Phycisphaerales bacterium]